LRWIEVIIGRLATFWIPIKGPGKNSLFFLTVYHPENSLFGDRVQWPEEPSTSVGSGALSTSLENPREGVVLQIVETEC
jgi:hypothetical protein